MLNFRIIIYYGTYNLPKSINKWSNFNSQRMQHFHQFAILQILKQTTVTAVVVVVVTCSVE
jgi:hypothetical protein